MLVILDNDKGRIELESYCVELSYDRSHLICHIEPKGEFLIFDLNVNHLFLIRDYNKKK